VQGAGLHNAGELHRGHVPAAQRHTLSAHARCSRHVIVIVTHREAGAARATTSALLMLAGRSSGDSTSWELPQRKGMNLGMRQEAACLTRCRCAAAAALRTDSRPGSKHRGFPQAPGSSCMGIEGGGEEAQRASDRRETHVRWRQRHRAM
jgi:hypothetical protein